MRPAKSGYWCVGTLTAIALIGCVHAGDPAGSYLTPYDINRTPTKYDGAAVAVAGWLDYGFEKRYLIAIDPQGNSTQDRARKGDCTSVEVPERLHARATGLTGKNVIVRGTFHEDLIGTDLNFGLCTLSGIRVETIDPLAHVAAKSN